MQEETLTTLKDILIPGLSMLVAGASVYFSYRQTRLQIRKNMRVQHIDRIRDTMTEIITILLLAKVDKATVKIEKISAEDIIRTLSRLLISLDIKKVKQHELGIKISECLGFINTEDYATKIDIAVPSIIELIQAAIQELENEI
jgi:hypothetical protein